MVCFKAFPRAWVRGKHDGKAIGFCKAIERADKLVKLILDIDILLAVHRKHKVLLLLNAVFFKRL